MAIGNSPNGQELLLINTFTLDSKMSFILTLCHSAISAISSQPTVYAKVIAFSTTTESKGI